MKFIIYRNETLFPLRKIVVSLNIKKSEGGHEYFACIDTRRMFGPIFGLKNFARRLERKKARMLALAKVTQA